MEYTNSHILSAVVSHWIQPLMGQLLSDKLISAIPFLTNVEAKIKSTGWVSQSWTIGKEIKPLLGGMSESIITPVIHSMLKELPEESIPEMAHAFVDNALEKGQLCLFEGMLSFDGDDLLRLKTLLDKNLPYHSESYCVKM